MTENLDSIALRVKYFRKTLNLTQSQLAGQLGVSVTSICEIENEKHKPNCDFLEKMALAFNINLYWLLFGEGEIYLDPGYMVKSKDADFSVRVRDVRNFLWHFQRSAIVQHSTLAHFFSLLVKDRETIEKEINDYNLKCSTQQD